MKSIILPGHRHLKAISLAKIVYLEGSSNYTVFHLTSGKELMVSQTLKKFKELPGFVRISKSKMVNRQLVERIERVDCKIAFVMTRMGLIFPIARRRIKAVIEEFYGINESES